jgi:hypothetical protein
MPRSLIRDLIFLARDLCRTIPEELSFQGPRGRRRIPQADLAVAAIVKAHRGLTGRRLGSLRDGGVIVELQQAGLISKGMHWNSVGNTLRHPQMPEVFEYLVETSALPLVPVERGDFSLVPVELGVSIDASIIEGVARVQEEDPYYRGQRERRIAKVHFVTGNRTNVITACAIEEPGRGESPFLPGLIYTTSKSFKIKNVFGDKAYTDYRSYGVVDALGGQGWFPFKKGNVGDNDQTAFGRMYHWAAAHSDEFWSMYFKRNNVEATISAFKRVLMSGLRHKTATLRNKKELSMRNELYSILVAHNLRVVIRFMYLHGIAPNFLPDAKDEPAYPSDESLPLLH